MRDKEGPAAVHDTVRMREGDSRSAFGADFYDGLGLVVGYKDAGHGLEEGGRSLLEIHWVDGEVTFALETAVVPVEYNEDIVHPSQVWERLKKLREEHGAS